MDRRETESQNLKSVIEGYLEQLGVPTNLAGYNYISSAVNMTLNDERMLSGITKIMYPVIADNFSTSAFAVERNIRTAIEAACKNGSADIRHMALNSKLHFTNKEFIFKVTHGVRKRLEISNNAG